MHWWYRMCDVCIERGVACCRLLCVDDITYVMCALSEAWHGTGCYALMISHAWCVHWKRRDMLPVVMHWWYHIRDVCIERGVTCYRLLCIDDITCVMRALKEAWHFAGHDKILDCRVSRALLAECLDVYVRFTLFTFARTLFVKLDELRCFQSLFCCKAIFVVLK